MQWTWRERCSSAIPVKQATCHEPVGLLPEAMDLLVCFPKIPDKSGDTIIADTGLLETCVDPAPNGGSGGAFAELRVPCGQHLRGVLIRRRELLLPVFLAF